MVREEQAAGDGICGEPVCTPGGVDADALSRERCRAQLYLDIAGSIIVELDGEGRVERINRAGLDLLGFPADTIIGSKWFESCVAEKDREHLEGLYHRLMSGELGQSERVEGRVRTLARGERLVAWRSLPVRSGDGGRIQGVICSGVDLTRQRRMEAALREGERIEAMGTLAETVSQNFGNILNAINGYASFLVDTLIPDTRAHRQAERIVDAVRHASDLTRRLMRVAKASSGTESAQLRSVDLEQNVRRTLELLDHLFTQRNVRVERRGGPLPSVRADAEQLIDVLMSIFTNAVEAMPSGGVVTVEAIERRITRPRANPDAGAGTFVGLCVRDTGVGMNRSIVRRVFEPFFTTKKAPSSFGLGLPVAQSMVNGMGGWIDVYSREGRGTLFRVFLAKMEPEEQEAAKQEAPPRFTVLVVDDSPDDLRWLASTLEGMGHKVHAATDAETALELVKELGDSLSVSLIDFMIPTGDKQTLPDQLLGAGLSVPMVLLSGFSRDFVRQRVSTAGWAFLQKPFTASQAIDVITAAVTRAGKEG
jgi:two-component system cell cycle sensor histidine kinase/response regulator CckA